MALRPKPAEQSDEVPAEPLAKAHPTWQTVKATRDWLHRHGLELVGRMQAGPLNRHEHAAFGWARANSWTRDLPGGYAMPEWLRLREAGVPPWGGAEAREWYRFVLAE